MAAPGTEPDTHNEPTALVLVRLSLRGTLTSRNACPGWLRCYSPDKKCPRQDPEQNHEDEGLKYYEENQDPEWPGTPPGNE